MLELDSKTFLQGLGSLLCLPRYVLTTRTPSLKLPDKARKRTSREDLLTHST